MHGWKIKSTQRKLSCVNSLQSETQRLHAGVKAGVTNHFELEGCLVSGESYRGQPVCCNEKNTFLLWFHIIIEVVHIKLKTLMFMISLSRKTMFDLMNKLFN